MPLTNLIFLKYEFMLELLARGYVFLLEGPSLAGSLAKGVLYFILL